MAADLKEAPHTPLRIGCHFGECLQLDDGSAWVGRAIILAKRVEDKAEPGCLYRPDANIATRYTLLSIAGAILGGSEFVGGRVSPAGAVLGALTLTLTTPFLTFLRLNPDFQIGAQGAILLLVLALRAIINRAEARA